MKEVNSELKDKLLACREWLSRELSTIRTGRASPAILDGVNVEIYGVENKISHIAAMSVEDARTIRISPWDKTSYKAIESAIQAANLGVSIAPDSSGLRVIFPELSTERREVMKKIVREKLEHARVSMRKERELALRGIEDAKKSKEIGEDEAKKSKEVFQKMVDECASDLEHAALRKEEELS